MLVRNVFKASGASAIGSGMSSSDIEWVAMKVEKWKTGQTQHYHILRFIAFEKNNGWTTVQEVSSRFPNIKDASVVMYDLARRNPHPDAYYGKQMQYPILEEFDKRYKIIDKYLGTIKNMM
jgi:uncharacterized protein YchJ